MNFGLIRLLLPRLVPLLVLDSGETTMPVGMDWYLNNAVLVKNTHPDPESVVMASPSLTEDDLVRADKDSSLYLPPRLRNGNVSTRDVPLYYQMQMLSDTVAHVKFIMLWPNNPSLQLFGGLCGSCAKAGGHQADIEHCTVEIRFVDGIAKPTRVFISSHGSGTWHLWESMEFRDNRLLLYVAKDSHALMAIPGKRYRIFGVVKDVCDGRGTVWDASELLEHLETLTPWNRFRGHLGWPGNVNVPSKQKWWDMEQTQSDTRWSRIFMMDRWRTKS